MRLKFTQIRMCKIKKTNQQTNKTNDSWCWGECEESRTLIHRWWKQKLVQSLEKYVWWFLRKMGIYVPQYLALPFVGKLQVILPHRHLLNHVSCCSIPNIHKQRKYPSWKVFINEFLYIFTMEYYCLCFFSPTCNFQVNVETRQKSPYMK